VISSKHRGTFFLGRHSLRKPKDGYGFLRCSDPSNGSSCIGRCGSFLLASDVNRQLVCAPPRKNWRRLYATGAFLYHADDCMILVVFTSRSTTMGPPPRLFPHIPFLLLSCQRCETFFFHRASATTCSRVCDSCCRRCWKLPFSHSCFSLHELCISIMVSSCRIPGTRYWFRISSR